MSKTQTPAATPDGTPMNSINVVRNTKGKDPEALAHVSDGSFLPGDVTVDKRSDGTVHHVRKVGGTTVSTRFA